MATTTTKTAKPRKEKELSFSPDDFDLFSDLPLMKVATFRVVDDGAVDTEADRYGADTGSGAGDSGISAGGVKVVSFQGKQPRIAEANEKLTLRTGHPITAEAATRAGDGGIPPNTINRGDVSRLRNGRRTGGAAKTIGGGEARCCADLSTTAIGTSVISSPSNGPTNGVFSHREDDNEQPGSTGARKQNARRRRAGPKSEEGVVQGGHKERRATGGDSDTASLGGVGEGGFAGRRRRAGSGRSQVGPLAREEVADCSEAAGSVGVEPGGQKGSEIGSEKRTSTRGGREAGLRRGGKEAACTDDVLLSSCLDEGSQQPEKERRKRGRKPGSKRAELASSPDGSERESMSRVGAAAGGAVGSFEETVTLVFESSAEAANEGSNGATGTRGEGFGPSTTAKSREPSFKRAGSSTNAQDSCQLEADSALGGLLAAEAPNGAAEKADATAMQTNRLATGTVTEGKAIRRGRKYRKKAEPPETQADDPYAAHPLRLQRKRCAKCEQEKELADYTRTVSTADGFNPFCRACHAAINAGRRGKVLPQASLEGRVCTDCKRHRPAVEFALKRDLPDGLKLRCRACDSLKQAEYRERVLQLRLELTHQECANCRETKPIGEFSRHRGLKTGHDTYCKKCQRVRYLAWKADRRPLSGPIVAEKKCARCEVTKPATEYARSVTNFDGLQTLCRDCVLAVRKDGGPLREGAASEPDAGND